MSVGVGTCAMLLGYFKVLCPFPLSHWIHVTTPGCVKGFFSKVLALVSLLPPTIPTVWLMLRLMADSCETVSQWYKGPRFLFLFFFFPHSSLSFTAWVIVSGSMSWLHVEGWCIDHRQSFDSNVPLNTENFCLRVNGHGLSPAHKGHSFIRRPQKKMPTCLHYSEFFCSCLKDNLILACTFCYSKCFTSLLLTCHRNSTQHIFVWSFYMHCWRRTIKFIPLRYFLTLFIQAWLAVQTQAGSSAVWVHVHAVSGTSLAQNKCFWSKLFGAAPCWPIQPLCL